MDYPTDLDLNGAKDVHTDASNDLALTSGEAQLAQSVATDAFDELQAFVGGRVTGTNIGKLEERLREAFNDDPQLASVQSVTIEEYDERDNTLSVSARVIEDDDFTLEVSA